MLVRGTVAACMDFLQSDQIISLGSDDLCCESDSKHSFDGWWTFFKSIIHYLGATENTQIQNTLFIHPRKIYSGPYKGLFNDYVIFFK